jgi:hypothetical protein
MTDTLKYDLHCHTFFSDGDLSPNELLQLAKERDITHLALTDHDTVAGLEQAQLSADNVGIELIPGIEFSCEWNGQLLHVLGLNIDASVDQLLSGIEENQKVRHSRAESMHQDFELNGIELRQEVSALVGERGVPTRPHFAQALIDKGLVKNKNQAFKRYLVKGKVGFVPMQWPSINQIANWIIAARGQPVLAHPTRYKFSRTKLIKLIEAMSSFGVRALEVSTPVTDPKQSKMLADLCIEFDLAASLGSDFHSHNQGWARLGGAEQLDSRLRPIWSHF